MTKIHSTLRSAALSAFAFAVFGPAFAATATPAYSISVDATVDLTAKCQFDSNAGLSFTGSNAPATYTAFQTAAVTKSLTAGVSCTRGTAAPTYSWDGDTSTTGNTSGVVQGLLYTLNTAATPTSAGAAPTYSNGTATAGTPRTLDLTVTFGIAAGQAGGANGSASIPQRTLTVSY